MQIIILGASSNVGTALAEAFALGNNLILVGRSMDRLLAARDRSEALGASVVSIIRMDLESGVDLLINKIQGQHIDLVIDASSASSAIKDSEADSISVLKCVKTDFTAGVELIGYLIKTQHAMPAVIYISTILVFVNSPNRLIYSSLKRLYQLYLKKIQRENVGFQVLFVYIGKIIDRSAGLNKPLDVAFAVRKAYFKKRKKLLIGWTGVLMVLLFLVQPFLFYLAVYIQRAVRVLSGR